MAIRLDDSLAAALGDTRLNERFYRWLWFYLNGRGAGFAPSEFDGTIMRDRMADFIEKRPWSKRQIDVEKTRLLLPDECLTWISKDDRQHQWLIPQIRNETGVIYETPPPRLLGRNLVVAMIDVWDTDASRKRAVLNNLEHAWIEHKKQDHIFRWFRDTDSARRCTLAWEWLCKNEPMLTQFSPAIEGYDELLKFFDRTRFSKDEKVLRIDAIKKRGSQQKYRENLTGKKQYNFMLSDKTIRRLDELAETYDLKRPQILEILIQMEAESGIYIPEKMKMIRNL